MPAVAGERAVQQQARGHGGRSPRRAFVYGQHEPDGPDQVWRDGLDEHATLALRLPDQADVTHRQVAETAVHQLGGGA